MAPSRYPLGWRGELVRSNTACWIARSVMSTSLAVNPNGPMSSHQAVPVLSLDVDGTGRHGKDELGDCVHGPEDVVQHP